MQGILTIDYWLFSYNFKGAVGGAHCEITDRPFTYDEIKWGLKKMKKGKASGLDGVSTVLLLISPLGAYSFKEVGGWGLIRGGCLFKGGAY